MESEFAIRGPDGPVAVDWTVAERTELAPDQLESSPPDGAAYADVPGAATKPKNYPTWSKQFGAWLSANEAIEVLVSPSTGECSNPDESERDFRTRVQHKGREVRDEAVEALRKKYAPKQAALQERPFPALVAYGIGTWFGVQAFIIIGGVVRVVPLTGVTLPFMSYGGSSLVANYVLLALLVRISDSTARSLYEVTDEPGVLDRLRIRRMGA